MNRTILLLLVFPTCVSGYALGQELVPEQQKSPIRRVPFETLISSDNVRVVIPRSITDDVDYGLSWLARKQLPGGGWRQGPTETTEAEKLNQFISLQGAIKKKPDPNLEDNSADIGVTAVALLALYRSGSTTEKGDYQENVRLGVQFLCRRVRQTRGSIFYANSKPSELQLMLGSEINDGLALLALAELHATVRRDHKQIRDAIEILLASLEDPRYRGAKNSPDILARSGLLDDHTRPTVLTLGVIEKAILRVAIRRIPVSDSVLTNAHNRILERSKNTRSLLRPKATFKRGIPDPRDIPELNDAGTPLYSLGQTVANLQDSLNLLSVDFDRIRFDEFNPHVGAEVRVAAARKLDQRAIVRAELDIISKLFADKAKDKEFRGGSGKLSGEDLLCWFLISDSLVIQADDQWARWNATMRKSLLDQQTSDGSWVGKTGVSGKPFCTSVALLTLLADRTRFPGDVIRAVWNDRPIDGDKVMR